MITSRASRLPETRPHDEHVDFAVGDLRTSLRICSTRTKRVDATVTRRLRAPSMILLDAKRWSILHPPSSTLYPLPSTLYGPYHGLMLTIAKARDNFIVRNVNLEFSFVHIGDRWQHRIAVKGGAGWLPFLVSEEGVADGPLFSGPAFQDLRCEELPDEAAEFQLLGQEGRAVYSAAIRFDAGAEVIDFDICARLPSMISGLPKSHYLVASGAALQQTERSAVASQGPAGILVEPVPLPGQPPPACRAADDGAVRRIIAGCCDLPSSDVPKKGFSVRWRYRMTPVLQPLISTG